MAGSKAGFLHELRGKARAWPGSISHEYQVSRRVARQPIAQRAETRGIALSPQGIQRLDQAVEGLVKRLIARPVGRQPARELVRDRAAPQLDRITEMAPSQRRIMKRLQGDLAQRHVDPQVVM